MGLSIRALLIPLFIGLLMGVVMVAFIGLGSSVPEEYIIETKVIWKDETINARSIEVRESGTLQIDNVTIVMRNEELQEGETTMIQLINRGKLFINHSVIKPSIYNSDTRYMFRCYGTGWLKNTLVDQPYSIQIFNNQFHLFNNEIQNPKTDGIYLKTGKEPGQIAVFRDNLIIDPLVNGFQIVDSRAVLDNNLVRGTEFDAYYIHNSDVNMTNCIVENIGRYMISIWENCTIDIYPETNITKGGVVFMDSTSLVRIHDEDGTTELRSSGNASTDSRLKLVAIGLLLILGLLGTFLFWHLNKQKMFQNSQKPSMVAYEGTTEESASPEESRESQKALVQEELGDMAMESGSDDAALEYFKRAVELNPRSDISLVKKGNVLEQLERYDEAVSCYISALKINKGNNKAREGRNRLSYLLGSTDFYEDDEDNGSEEKESADGSPSLPQDEEGLVDESEPEGDLNIPEMPVTEGNKSHEIGINTENDDIPKMPDYTTEGEGSETGSEEVPVIKIEEDDMIPLDTDGLKDEQNEIQMETEVDTLTDDTVPLDEAPEKPETKPLTPSVAPVTVAPLSALKAQIKGLRKRVTKERELPAEESVEEADSSVPLLADEEPGISDDIPVMPTEVGELPSEHIPTPIAESPEIPDDEHLPEIGKPWNEYVAMDVGRDEDGSRTGTESGVPDKDGEVEIPSVEEEGIQESKDEQPPSIEQPREEPVISEPETEPEPVTTREDNRISLLEELLSLRAEQSKPLSWREGSMQEEEPENPPAEPEVEPHPDQEFDDEPNSEDDLPEIPLDDSDVKQAVLKETIEEEKEVPAMPTPIPTPAEVPIEEKIDVPAMPAPIPETPAEVPIDEEKEVLSMPTPIPTTPAEAAIEEVPSMPTPIPETAEEAPMDEEKEVPIPSPIPEEKPEEKKGTSVMDELGEWLNWKGSD